jgi:predicted dehydrogenase
MKILIVGLGSIGRRHVNNIKIIRENSPIAVLREHSRNADLGELQPMVCQTFLELSAARAWQPEIVFVTNPAPLHVATALTFAKDNCHLFIEKPLSDSLEGIDTLLHECEKRRLILTVGYVLRFLEPFQIMRSWIDQGKIGEIMAVHATVGRYLPEWRPHSDYRNNTSARRNLGGGVVLELSHELDYVRWLIGEIREVSAFVDRVSNLEIDVEDIAEINLRFENKAMGHIHLDMLDRSPNRSCRIIGTQGTLCWDFDPHIGLRLFSCATQEWETVWKKETWDYNSMFIAQLEHFFDCIEQQKKPLVTGQHGRRIVEIITAVKTSAAQGTMVRI